MTHKRKISDCSAAILAGGKNTRYGGFHKAFLRIDNQLIIEKHIELLSTIFEDVIIIANEEEIFQQFSHKVYSDIYKDRGPLAGIHSALKNSTKEAVMVFGCDMPFLEASVIKSLYTCWKEMSHNICVPKTNGYYEPLHALYSRNILDELEYWLDNRKENAVYKFLNEHDVYCINKEIKPSVFVNINSPEDANQL
jgi:molybdopterin-guanine dinucleotide biosynthesis protein A